MSYYQKNLASLEKRYPHLHQKLLALSESASSIDFHEEKMLSTLDQSLSVLNEKKPSFLAFYGLGSGAHIKKYFESKTHNPEFVFFAEASLLNFKEFLSLNDWTGFIECPAFFFCVSQEKEEIYNSIYQMLNTDGVYFSLNGKCTLSLPAQSQEAQEAYKWLEEILERVEDFVPPGSLEDNYKAYRNIVENLSSSLSSFEFESLKSKFSGKPGILISSGPSLEKSLPFLKEVQDKAILFCADSALKPLLKEGIQVHAVACLERLSETARFFEGLPDLPDTYLLASPYIYPEIYKNYPGPRLDMMRSTQLISWFYPQREFYDTRSSVAHMNYVALKDLGCDPIYLVGQDLAFDPHSNATHVSGLDNQIYEFWQKHREESRSETADFNLVPSNIEGKQIETSRVFFEFKMILEALISEGPKTLNVIPQEYGAKIAGAEQIEPQVAFEKIKAGPSKIGKLKDYLSINDEEVLKRKSSVEERIKTALLGFQNVQHVCLEMMDATSIFMHQNDIRFHEEARYQVLFEKIQTVMTAIIEDQDGLFEHLIYPVIRPQFIPYYNSILTNIRKKESMQGDFVPSQLGLVMNLFQLFYTWVGRLNRFLEKGVNGERA